MNMENLDGVMSADQFASLGEGRVAYVRKMQSDDLIGRYPGLPELDRGLELWALFSADGQPILLTGELQSALAGAVENELTAVAIH